MNYNEMSDHTHYDHHYEHSRKVKVGGDSCPGLQKVACSTHLDLHWGWNQHIQLWYLLHRLAGRDLLKRSSCPSMRASHHCRPEALGGTYADASGGWGSTRNAFPVAAWPIPWLPCAKVEDAQLCGGVGRNTFTQLLDNEAIKIHRRQP